MMALAGAAEAGPPKKAEPVGLSLWFEDGEVRYEDGSPKTVTLYEELPRYIDELDITAKVETTTDQGIQPVIDQGDLSGLDWSGVHQVDEDWRPDLANGGFTRSRFYRGARWMERNSTFQLVPVDARDRPVNGGPLHLNAGFDDKWLNSDDAFIRRFDARQITYGCPAIGDCTGATRFVAQGLVQLRVAQKAKQRATKISKKAEYLRLTWSEDSCNPRYVPIEHAKYSDTDWEYGFAVEVDVAPPANGTFFQPGEAVHVTVTFTDGAGNRLHPPGELPSYAEFATDAIDSGLRYYDGLQELLTLYYALKHREGLGMWSLAGPTNALRFPSTVVSFNDFFLPQTEYATVETDGFTSLAIFNPTIPDQLIMNPERPSDTVTFVLPDNAKPGTYVVTIKGRRDWGGEARNAAETVEIQVGTPVETGFFPTTGNCQNCHTGTAELGNILHGVDDRRACYSCHSTMDFEPDHALDYRIHLIHTRSERFPGNPNNCSTCHLTPPSGPPRGFPGIGPY
jgi:hypothetical protein